MNVLFFVTRIITFFGSTSRLFWEFLMCRACRLPIEDIRCFKVGELASHVEHEIITKKSHAFAICFFPFFINLVLGACCLMFGSFMISYMGIYTMVLAWVCLWAGVSFWSNLFPLVEDVYSFKDSFYGKGSNIFLKIIMAPFFAVIFVCSRLERYSVTVLTSVAAALAFPFVIDSVLFPILSFFKV